MPDAFEQNSPAPDTDTPFDLTGETEREQLCHAAGFSGAYEQQERKAATLVDASRNLLNALDDFDGGRDGILKVNMRAALAAWEAQS